MSRTHHISNRRPRLDEMDRMATVDVRRKVDVADQTFSCSNVFGSFTLDLLWLQRWGGTFGPSSAAFARQLRLDNNKPINESRLESRRSLDDRGMRPAWILFFSCPACKRRCRVLYSLKGINKFACVKCNRPAYQSNTWPHTGRRNAGGASMLERTRLRHRQTAARITKKYLRPLRKEILANGLAGAHAIPRPARMTKARFEILRHRIVIHKQLEFLASLKIAEYHLTRIR